MLKIRTYVILILWLLSGLSELKADIFPNKAPEFTEISSWINSEPLQMADLRGHVVLVDFWDYSCINCIRTFPHLKHLYETYKDKGLVVIGVHSPEFAFEKERQNVVEACKRYGLTYPVALDNNFATWKAYSNSFWPSTYVIDQKGRIRFRHFGEGDYDDIENTIRYLLDLPSLAKTTPEAPHVRTTNEIYLGSERAENYAPGTQLKANAVQDFSFQEMPQEDEVSLKGPWKVTKECITSEGDSVLVLNFTSGRVHLVAGGKSDTPLTLLLDGKPLEKSNYTADMNDAGEIVIQGGRKYDLLDLQNRPSRHTLTLKVPRGISLYTFTFGP